MGTGPATCRVPDGVTISDPATVEPVGEPGT
jgi:hypothetical protein